MSDDGDVELGDRLNDLGALILERIGDADAKVLLYAEVDESGDTVFLVFRRPGEACLRALDEIGDISDSISAAWEHSRSGAAAVWRGMTYLIEDRKMKVTFHYGDEVGSDPLMIRQTQALLAEHFPGLPYSAD